MFNKLSHIGIAVGNLEAASEIFSRLLNVKVSGSETVADQKVRLAFFHAGNTSLELLEPTSPDSPIAKFIGKRGEGIHHLSFEVDDIRAELARLKVEGYQLIDEQPRRGAGGLWIAFLHPKSTNGVLIEISQKIVNS
ncbi:MAG: methylmalonyl-CoA epimerase [Bacteroidota bacterium]|jgi:methylmalonyl-CoA/ethylmalonyl-CoA epimerase